MERQRNDDLDSLQCDSGHLAELAFPNHKILFSETFLQKSRESYGTEWLVREIVQNFIDANTNSPGTLDGVRLTKTPLEHGKTRYVITGNWPFKDYTGLVYLHSDKTDETVNTAGGNGIGIKQSALRMMRDYGISKFSIIGEGWSVDYCFAGTREINDSLQQQGISRRVKNGFLMVHPQRAHNAGRCFYVIETKEGDFSETLDRFYNLGVCRQNTHLREMNYENPAGALKWLPLDKKGKMQLGKLFLNGQISRCKNLDPTSSIVEKYQALNGKDYWGGPEGMTIRLNDVQQKISMDRPPVGFSDLDHSLQEFINKMGKEDLIKNLVDSEYIWSSMDHKFLAHYEEYFFCFRFIRRLVRRLNHLGFSENEYKRYFGNKAYYYVGRQIGEEQAKELLKEGYKLCPACFSLLHMPPVPPIVEPRLAEDYERPHLDQIEAELFAVSQRSGVDVPYKKVSGGNAATLARKLKRKFPNEIGNVVPVQDLSNTLYIFLNNTQAVQIDAFNLASKSIIHSQDPEDKFLCFLRGMIFRGLARGIFKDVVLFSKGYFTTFSANSNSGVLGVRNISRDHDSVALQIIFGNAKSCAAFKKELERKIILPEGIRLSVRIAVACILVGVAVITVKSEVDNRPATDIDRKAGNVADIAQETQDKARKVGVVSLLTGEEKTHPEEKPAPATRGDNSASKAAPNHVLHEIVDKHNATGVLPSSTQQPESEKTDGSTSDVVENFYIIGNIKPKQKEQLEILRDYVNLLTGYSVPVNLFIYTGEGADGVNMNGNIGLHEKVLQSDFSTALSVFNHEMAHNLSHGHGINFIRADSALHVEREIKLSGIARQVCSERDTKAKKILGAEKKWDRLRKTVSRGR